MRYTLQIFLYTLIIAGVFWSCQKEEKDDHKPDSVGLKLDTLSLNHSIKGWELYSWNENSPWTYSLLIGTNAVKSLSQVKNNPIRIVGEDSLRILLTKLREEEEIFCIGKQWLISTWNSDKGNIKLPPRDIRLYIKEFCSIRAHKLQIVE